MTHRMLRVVLFALLAMTVAFPAASTVAFQSSDATPVASEPKLPATVTDVNGNQVTVTDVSRIVPLSGDIAEIVWTLGFGANIVGVDVSAVYPPELRQLPQIGFERQLSAEGILSLNPTLVIGKEQAGPPPVLEQIRAAGVPLVIVAEPQTIEAPTAKIRAVAEALGVTDAGEELAAKTQQEIDEARALAATATSKPTVLFLYVRGGGTQLIGGAGSVADAMIDAAGGVDAGVAAGIQGFVPITAEAVVAAQPDVIIVPQSGVDSIGGVEALLQVPGVAETPAAKEGRILVYEDLLFLGMTPRTGQMVRQLALDLHPELAGATPVASPAA
ncbi:MAG: heme transport system substrate-binding protein [Thermomicrobiales bacterium]|nr:heme transport system substrate-binding protein [Thermomicrobiales bacterium]